LTPRLIINKDASDTRSVNKVPYFPRASPSRSLRRPRSIPSDRLVAVSREKPSLFLRIVSESCPTLLIPDSRLLQELVQRLRGRFHGRSARVPARDLSHYFLLETRDVKGNKAGGSRIRRRKGRRGVKGAGRGSRGRRLRATKSREEALILAMDRGSQRRATTLLL